MTLRRIDSTTQDAEPANPTPEMEDGWNQSTSLRWRLSLLSATLVTFAVGIITVAAYWTVSSSLTSGVDVRLEEKADALLDRASEPGFYSRVEDEINVIKAFDEELQVTLSPSGWEYVIGDSIALPSDFNIDSIGTEARSLSIGGDRMLIKRDSSGTTAIFTQDMTQTHQFITSLGVFLLIISGIGVLASIAAGFVISSAGLKPLGRLQKAVDRVARTDELRAIPVLGNDELAGLTISFNQMLAALRESRLKQSQLVADAGHELKTPLTSMRTNIELLMMAARPDAPNISEQDRKELEHDVLAQMEELSNLIGDLVDLAREETVNILEPLKLNDSLETALERTERRRPEVCIKIEQIIPWYMVGDEFSLTRALVNVFDNALKWSPEGGVVRIKLIQQDQTHVRLTVEDSGPGIPVEERDAIFDRFYRAIKSRSMPGSGLGLAIVKQIIENHSGRVEIADSTDGGTKVIITLPGSINSEFQRVAAS